MAVVTDSALLSGSKAEMMARLGINPLIAPEKAFVTFTGETSVRKSFPEGS